MTFKTYDVIIVGAGPAGCACAAMLKNTALRVAIIDKSTFPRDKVCGDMLSADVYNQLLKIEPEMASDFQRFKSKKKAVGIRFFAPDTQVLDIDFNREKKSLAREFVSKRIDFDHFFLEQIKKIPSIDLFIDCKLEDVHYNDDQILIETAKGRFKTTMLLGADGANSIVSKKLLNKSPDKKHMCAGLRQYYADVKDLSAHNHIELHFYKELLPGYLWVFPLPDNQANVGMGMLSHTINKQGVNLKEKFRRILQEHPNLKDRFLYAKPLEKIKGFSLPLGSKKRIISGNRFLLLGDAAGLIDPFTGEGIGNAIRSGRIAAKHIKKAFKENTFGAHFNKMYDREVYSRMWPELRLSYGLQKLLRFPFIFNFLVKKAAGNKSIQMLLTSMLNDINIKKELLKPKFYFTLFFK